MNGFKKPDGGGLLVGLIRLLMILMMISCKGDDGSLKSKESSNNSKTKIDPNQNLFLLAEDKEFICIAAKPGTGYLGVGHSMVFLYTKGKLKTILENPYGVSYYPNSIYRILKYAHSKGSEPAAILCSTIEPAKIKIIINYQLELDSEKGVKFEKLKNNCTDFASKVFYEVTGIILETKNFAGVSNPTTLKTSILELDNSVDYTVIENIRDYTTELHNILSSNTESNK